MKRWVIIAAVLFVAGFSGSASGEETYFSYDDLMEFGRRSLHLELYDKAETYFRRAARIEPQSPEPQRYLNLIRQTTGEPFVGGSALSANSQHTSTAESTSSKQEYLSQRKTLDLSPPSTDHILEIRLALDNTLWQQQPNMRLELERDQRLILEGINIERFLILSEGFITAERKGSDELHITAINKGATFIHIWDDQGRWTFHIQVKFPQRRTIAEKIMESERIQQRAEPWRMRYSSNWNSYYIGDTLKDVERQNLSYSQSISMLGPTPYGKTYGFITLNKFDLSTEITGYGGGISDGKIGPFKDFSIRGGDTSKRFSSLTLPGKYFRGGLLDAYAFDRRINYTYLYGRDRSVFNFVSPGIITDEREAFIEGMQVTFWPDGPHSYALNYGRGFGAARESFLKEKVFSFEAQNNFERIRVDSEIAHDENSWAKLIDTKYKGENYNLGVSFRDIEDDFVTLTSIPPDQGEIGGIINFNYYPENFSLNGSFDIYQERLQTHPTHPDLLNYDFTLQSTVPIGKQLNWRTSLFYVDSPGSISPRRSTRANSQLSKTFRIWQDKILSTFIGGSFQRSRFSLSPASEYDRHGLSTGFRLPITRGLDYFANYSYDWVSPLATSNSTTPHTLSTGFNYSRKLTDKLSGRLGLTYRNEEEGGGSFSFLAGEDSLTGDVSLSYQPARGTEIFADGRVRNVWSETNTGVDFIEADLRFGVRLDWAMPVRWSNKGYVGGRIYKDLNKNGWMDEGEDGIPNVRVLVGNTETITDKEGDYFVSVRAQSVLISVDMQSLPEGFIVNTSLTRKVDLKHRNWHLADFGISAQSGVYGVVYFDANQNNRLDADDHFVPRVKITLDGTKDTYSDFEGGYFFENVKPGTHTVSFDVNTIPLKYLPRIKVRSELEIHEGSTYILHIPLGENIPSEVNDAS